MSSPHLLALSCSQCGASLPVDQQDPRILVCQYCGQSHAFVPPPPPERRGARYRPGERVAVEWGNHWWPATVGEAVGDHEWRVHFDNWGHNWDVVVGPSRIRHISAATRAAQRSGRLLWPVLVAALALTSGLAAALFFSLGPGGAPSAAGGPSGGGQERTPRSGGPGDPALSYAANQAVEIYWGSSWYPGKIEKISDQAYFISYDGWSATWNEWVDASNLRLLEASPAKVVPAKDDDVEEEPAGATAKTPASYEKGQAVEIEWNGSWYAGRILQAKGAEYKITYDGYSSSWDEWVGTDRLRSR